MSVFDKKEKHNWNWLPSIYKHKIIRIRKAVKRQWDEFTKVNPQLVNFTPHGPEHSKSVEDIIHRLIPNKNLFKRLTERERFYLLASAWLHDIGMIWGIAKEDSGLPDEKVRTTHHERSAKFITNFYMKLDIDPDDVSVLSLLAYYHGADLDDCKTVFPTANNEIVRLALLAAYLRIADALDIGQSRSPFLSYAICLAYNIPMSSKLHWIKSRLISGMEISPEGHRITVFFKALNDDRNTSRPTISDQNLAKLRKLIMDDLKTNIDSSMSILVREGITYLLDINSCTVKMEIDAQISPELSRLTNNFEMMVNPSATKLRRILLGTIKGIIDPNNDGKSPKINALEDVNKFINEVKDEIITTRHCHFGLRSLIKKIETVLSQKDNNEIIPLKNMVDSELNNIEKEKIDIRDAARNYFTDIYNVKTSAGKLTDYITALSDKIKLWKNDTQQDSQEQYSPLTRYLIENIEEKHIVNILLFGMSELVMKSLTGFRDFIIWNLNCRRIL